jgi:hypothetical protein
VCPQAPQSTFTKSDGPRSSILAAWREGVSIDLDCQSAMCEVRENRNGTHR